MKMQGKFTKNYLVYFIFDFFTSSVCFALENNQSISNKEEADKKENKNQITSLNNSAIIGSENEQTENCKTRNRITTSFKEPTITNVTVTGDFDKDKRCDFFKNSN